MMPCPEFIFALPLIASFIINNVSYTGSQTNLDHVEPTDILNAMRTNMHLRPRVNLTSLKQKPMEETDGSNKTEEGSNLMSHPMTWTTFGCICLIITLVGGMIIHYAKTKTKTQPKTTTKPKPRKRELPNKPQPSAPSTELRESESDSD